MSDKERRRQPGQPDFSAALLWVVGTQEKRQVMV